jgi:G3E family GTPase
MIPVVIVTGFLGSGKTTLISRVLRDPAFARTAVIVNEFGEIGLDHELIETSDESLISLSTGCLCCAVRSDLVQTLLDLDRRRRAGEIPEFDRVLIETSGLADPAPILQSLMTDTTIARTHAIDTVVTLVDAQLGADTLARHPEARRQAALADRIVLTKTDVAGDSEALRARLAALNPGADLLVAVSGRIAPESLFLPSDPTARATRMASLPAAPAASPFIRAQHTDGVETFVLEREAPISGLALILLLESLAEHCGERLLRVKGLVRIAEMPDRPAVIHGVQHIFATPEFLPRWPSKDQRTRIVFIAQGVPRHFPARLLAAIEAEVLDETNARRTT